MTDIRLLKTTEKRLELLRQMNIHTLEDLVSQSNPALRKLN